MPEDHQPLPAQEPAARRPRSSRSQQRRSRRSVFQYITILFAAALVLLLYTFMMERRQFEQQQEQDKANISDLQQQSVSAVQTLKGLTEANEQLKQQTAQLEEEIEALENQLAGAEHGQGLLQNQLQNQERTVEAMTWFWELNDAYVRGRMKECRELIASMEAAGFPSLLPAETSTGTGRLSPAQRYQEIYDRAMK